MAVLMADSRAVRLACASVALKVSLLVADLDVDSAARWVALLVDLKVALTVATPVETRAGRRGTW